MPSSTSNSKERAPSGPWGRTWLLVILVFVICFGSWEGFWRARGHRPSVTDEAHLWALSRFAIGEGRQRVAILGSSRAQVDIDLDSFANFTGDKPVQLAIPNCAPHVVLGDFAENTSFSGLVIVGVAPALFFDARQTDDATAHEYIELFKSSQVSPSGRLEVRLKAILQESFVFKLPELAPRYLVDTRRWPSLRPVSLRADRARFVDYQRYQADPENWSRHLASQRHHSKALAMPMSHAQRAELLSVTRANVEKIEGRGGRVVFVRFPSGGEILNIEQGRFPREQYWDALAASTSAVMIHFSDHPELSAFHCPDESHLDQADTASFTRALLKILLHKLGQIGTVQK